MLHKSMPASERHAPWSWEFADAAARTGATGFVAGDVGKLARQVSDNTAWMLTATTPTWAAVGSGVVARELLTANRTYYVATTGSDSNNGLSVGAPFLTIQKAFDVAASVDTGIYDVTIQLADGTYTGNLLPKPMTGGGKLILKGNLSTPSNVVIHSTSGITLLVLNGVAIQLAGGVKITAVGTGVAAARGGVITITGVVDFGTCGNQQLTSVDCGALVIESGYTISGSAAYHLMAMRASSCLAYLVGHTVTLVGTPAFSSAFIEVNQGATVLYAGMTISGSATGKRYSARINGSINVGGAGVNYLPGNVAGTTETGGQYA